jgi:EAL domain-containing protein (putative c-di-GMP-specific phosphodiesterase class I)
MEIRGHQWQHPQSEEQRNLASTKETLSGRDSVPASQGISSTHSHLLAEEEMVLSVLQTSSLTSVFQPVVRHRERQIVTHELLSRPKWGDTQLNPECWFRSAARQGYAMDADLLAIRSGLKAFASYAWTRDIELFVNVMPDSLSNPKFVGALEAVLSECSFPGTRLVMELTEYHRGFSEELARALRDVRALGVRLALDDVRPEEDAMIHALYDLQPEFVKVDRSVLEELDESEEKRVWLKHLTKTVKGQAEVIAEGVEQVEVLSTLEELGIHLSQGYYWSPPVSVPIESF